MSNGRKFTIEYKIRAVELAMRSEKPIVKTAKLLKLAPSVLGEWIKRYDELKKAQSKDLL